MTTHDPETIRRLLERDVAEWADDLSLRLVWADLLLIDGDPLGRLVMLDHAGTQKGPEAAKARAEAEVLRRELKTRLWDNGMPPQQGVEFKWELGFVSEVDITVGKLKGSDAAAPSGRRRDISAPWKEADRRDDFASVPTVRDALGGGRANRGR